MKLALFGAILALAAKPSLAISNTCDMTIMPLVMNAMFTRQDDPILTSAETPANTMRLEDLDLSMMSTGWGSARSRLSIDGNPIKLNGTTFAHGVGTHADSAMLIKLNGAVARFVSMVGLDDERAGSGSVRFHILVDGKEVTESGVMRGNEAPKMLSVDLTGKQTLILTVDDAGDGVNNDHADWAGAYFTLAENATTKPTAAYLEDSTPVQIHTGESALPAIHGPRIAGVTPGHPFLFKVPATGAAPLTYGAAHLPAGLSIDKATGIITGSVQKAGTYKVTCEVRGPKGAAKRSLTIVVGKDKLALTPPMGWNSWYAWFGAVDQEKVAQAAEWMVKSGLAAHGYQYVNIDDCWQGKRDDSGEIVPNNKFPDMKALADRIHRLGLRFGTYSSPGPQTCAGFEGSYNHELQDIETYAKWGVDFVKYDWCSYGSIAKSGGTSELMKPYAVLQKAMATASRDMVFSLCQYGMGDVWKWGASVGGNMWRTTGDSGDTWGIVSSIGFGQNGLEKYSGPGHWNDPDMIQAGYMGGSNQRKTHLTRQEQVMQMTLWSLLAAPILLSCDLSKLDQFTKDLLMNDEVLDVDQDPLGKQASCRVKNGQTEIWARPLVDGTVAVGLFNRGYLAAKITVKWSDLALKGRLPVRNIWMQKNLGVFDNSFTADVAAHGAVYVKIGRSKRID